MDPNQHDRPSTSAQQQPAQRQLGERSLFRPKPFTPHPPAIEFSPERTIANEQLHHNPSLHRLPREIIKMIFVLLDSADHCSLRQTTLIFYHIIHSMYEPMRRLVIKTYPKKKQNIVLNVAIDVCMRQCTAIKIDFDSTVVKECNFDLASRVVTRRHLILLRQAFNVTQLVFAQSGYRSDQLASPETTNIFHFLSGLAESISLELVKIIVYSGDGNPIMPNIIEGLRSHSNSLRHFSFYSRAKNDNDYYPHYGGLAFFHSLEELYIGSFSTRNYHHSILSGELKHTRRLGFYQKELSKIAEQIRAIDQGNTVSHLTIRDIKGLPFELTDEIRALIQNRFPNALLL